MRNFGFVAWVFSLGTFTACIPSPAPVPPDASDSGLKADAPGPVSPDAINLACSNMKTAGCPEGAAANCASSIAQTLDAGITLINVSCLGTATTAAQVKACGITCGSP